MPTFTQQNGESKIMKGYQFLCVVFCVLMACHGQSSAAPSLKYIGHSFVKIKTTAGTVIYIDPYAVNDFTDSADVVLVTHEHSDHNDLSRVKQRSTCRVIRAVNALIAGTYQTFVIGDVTITGVPAYNNNHPVNACVGFVIEFDGMKVYHAGDTGLITEMANLATQHITYAMLPMDAVYTMTPANATLAAARIQALHDIPIHTMAPPDTYSDSYASQFSSPNKMIVKPGVTIELAATTSAKSPAALPATFSLAQNYPNPFNPTTEIRFQLPSSGDVSLKVYDVLGTEQFSLVNTRLAAGEHRVVMDGRALSSGVYFYTMTAGGFTASKKMMLLR
jgi:hypothetical protein